MYVARVNFNDIRATNRVHTQEGGGNKRKALSIASRNNVAKLEDVLELHR